MQIPSEGSGCMSTLNQYLIPPMPQGLEGLAEAGIDMRWSWNHTEDPLWNDIDPDLWNLTHNPWLILQTVSFSHLTRLAQDKDFLQQVDEHLHRHRQALEGPSWFSEKCPASSLSIAYFSMEFGLSEALPIYSGGLGVLAGDYLKTASDLGVPVVGIGLLYQQGYFRQVIDADGKQMELYPSNNPGQLPVLPARDKNGEWVHIEMEYPGRSVRVRVWEVKVGRVKLYLLDSNDPVNSPADRGITAELYAGGREVRLQQEIILGIGGWRLLRLLGIDAQICHLNEGHAALAVIERARSFMDDHQQPFNVALTATRAGNVFTTHTPVDAGFDRFSPSVVRQYLEDYTQRLGIGLDGFLALGRQDSANTGEPLNMAYLAMRGSGIINGVSRLHGAVSRRIFQPMFPRWPQWEIPVTHVTNGVHMPTWDSAIADKLWSESCGKERWLGTMNTIEADIKGVPDKTLWTFRNEGRLQLIRYVRERFVRQLGIAGAPCQEIQDAQQYLDPNALTLGFARRFALYKRPTLLLHDSDRLARLLLRADRPVQLIVAGKAHPYDYAAKMLVQAWASFIRRADIRSHVIFLADYDMILSEHLVQGIDLWINTPRRPMEACGTSGMKVLVNGGINLSSLDGWWAEAYRPQVGWAFGDDKEWGSDSEQDARDAEELYRLLEEEIIPAFYNRDSEGIPKAWVARMKMSMAELTSRFSANRMVRDYVERLYAPAARQYRERTMDKAHSTIALCQWIHKLDNCWAQLHFGEFIIEEKNGNHHFMVKVFLGEIDPTDILVELFAEPLNGPEPEIHSMACQVQSSNLESGYWYGVCIPAARPASDYTPRIIPHFNGASVPLETNHILWRS